MIDLLVIDDSALVRQVVKSMLADQADIAVRVAADALIASTKIRAKRPDVLLLDLEMPRMDGLTFLRNLKQDHPIPTVVCSSLGARGGEQAMQALQIGAVEVLEKPRVGIADFLTDSKVLLIDAIRAAARVRISRPDVTSVPAEAALGSATDAIVAVGASTGGTEALWRVLRALPSDAPGTVVVQHMPAGFTAAFARRLDRDCAMEVKEAETGDRVAPGRVLIAPGNRHLIVRRSGDEYVVNVNDGPLVSRHRPSVDVLFESVAEAAGHRGVGVIMTGMGNDGAKGLLSMRKAGAATIGQDEATCIVFGMPKEAIAAGAVQEVVPLDRIAHAIMDTAIRRQRNVAAASKPAKRS